MTAHKKYTVIAAVFLFCSFILATGRAEAFMLDTNAPAPADLRCVIVIDPGHGGDDFGALGHGGAEEKKITLGVSKKLSEALMARLGCKVLLTRRDDAFIPLRERTAFANANNADIFISVHANAAPSKDASGLETFFLSVEATDDDARRLAAMENNASNGVGRAVGPEFPDDLQEILSDLTQSLSHHESSSLAESVQTGMVKALGQTDRGVKQAPFIVLIGAAMPAVLVEVGFISNPVEEKRLTSVKEQGRIAEAIADGVAEFKKALSGREHEFIGFRQAGKKAGE